MQEFTLTRNDPEYPAALAHAHPPPEILYGEGDPSIMGFPAVSIVGSRKIDAYGEAVIKLLVPPLIRAGLTVVSGLAYGVDAAAHRVALAEGGACVAVLGSALNRLYPSGHQGLREKVARSGCVITEYPPGTEARPYHFPARNRIVAALSPAIVIIEAGEGSGTLTTARHAHDMGKAVCVVPADIVRAASTGSNSLLKEGAIPVTCAEDILVHYAKSAVKLAPVPLRPALTGSPALLYDLVSRGCSTTEGLLNKTGWDVSRLNSVLSILEIDGYIARNQQQWLTISSS